MSKRDQLPLFGGTDPSPLMNQPEGTLSFDGTRYHYQGFVIDPAGSHQFFARSWTFLPEHIGVVMGEDPSRIRAMIDTTGRDLQRQREIAVYGERRWHSPLRPEPAVVQALDWAFRHNIEATASCQKDVQALFHDDPQTADRWIAELYRLYPQRKQEESAFSRVLAQGGIPLSASHFL